MGLERSLKARVVTPFDNCVQLIEQLVQDFWRFNEDGSVYTLKADDTENYDFIIFQDYQEVKQIFLARESNGLPVTFTLWDREYDDSILVTLIKMENTYGGFTSQYELHLRPGYGKRIEGANRYTDYGFYLNQLIPKLLRMGCYVCEIKCHDFDS